MNTVDHMNHGIHMNLLWDMQNKLVLVYLDEIQIFSKTKQKYMWCVLQRLLENQLFNKAQKYEFHVSNLSFLGFIVTAGCIQMDPTKV